MPIQVDSAVLKQDVANALVSETGTNQNYIDNVPDYTVNNINSLFANAVYIPANFNAQLLCKTINLPSPDTLFRINRGDLDAITENEVCAKFDTLSTMFATAAIPATNIRKSNFIFLSFNGSDYQVSDVIGYASLTDNAILSNNTQKWANNVNPEPLIITGPEQVVSYGGIESQLTSLRNELVNDYNEDPNAQPLISANVLSNAINGLSALFLQALSTIKDDPALTCKFTDDYQSHTVTLNYYQYNDGGDKKTYTKTRYSRIVIPSYLSQWTASEAFQGWTLRNGGKTVDFREGDSLLLVNTQYDFYPVFTAIVTYDGASMSNDISTKDPDNVARPSYVKAKEQILSSNSIKEYVLYDTTNFALPNVSNYFQGLARTDGKTLTLQGWKKKSPSPTSSAIDYITTTNLTINEDYVFSPVYTITSTYTPPSAIYDNRIVDICIKNNTNIPHRYGNAQEDAAESAPFDIKIPLNGICSLIGTNNNYTLMNYSNAAVSINSLGFRMKNGLDMNYIKSISLSAAICGNTKHRHDFAIRIYQNSNNVDTLLTSYADMFPAAETSPGIDDFGGDDASPDGYRMWGGKNFTNVRTSDQYTFNYVFNFTLANINVSKSYIKFTGKTGWSTDDSYPYRCRARFEITSTTIGSIYN